MNRRVSEQRVRLLCRELLKTDARLSGRGLRRELRERFGAVGKTARVFQIWREESALNSPVQFTSLPTDVSQLQGRLEAAEAAAQENLARAERAEFREQAHQDRWAAEIDRLRQDLRAQPKYAAEIRALQQQVLELTVRLNAARSELLKAR